MWAARDSNLDVFCNFHYFLCFSHTKGHPHLKKKKWLSFKYHMNSNAEHLSFLFLGLTLYIKSNKIKDSARKMALRRSKHLSHAGLLTRDSTHNVSPRFCTDPMRLPGLSICLKSESGEVVWLAGWVSVLGLATSQEHPSVRTSPCQVGSPQVSNTPNILPL